MATSAGRVSSVDVKRFKKHYPGTRIEKNPFVPERDMLYFYEDPYYIGVPCRCLTDREQAMLKTLLSQEIPPKVSERARLWYDVLFNGKVLEHPDRSVKIRMIQFRVAGSLSQSDLSEWREALEAFFKPSACFIYLSSKQGLIIEEQMSVSEESLRAIANTLENDFSVKSHFQIGLRYPVSEWLPEAYREENQLFRQHIAGSGSKEVTSVESNFFTLLKPLANEWAILGESRAMIAEDTSWISIIRALWNNQGNVSLAAKHLFMHRNTLHYRIDKFYELTGISLKKMDGLTIAYLSTL